MKKKFTLIALAFLSVMAFAYQQVRKAPGDPTVLYSWEGQEVTSDAYSVEEGGTVAYTNGDGDRLNYKQGGYYTMCLNGKKANIDDATASTNAGHMLITLYEELQEGDEIAITAFLNNASEGKKSSAYVVFEKGDPIDTGDYADESNIGLSTPGVATTKTITVAAGNAGSKTIKLTRGTTGTNLFITKLVITRAESSSEEPVEEPTENTATVDFTDNGYANAEEVTSVTENGITVVFDKGTNANTPKWYNSGTAVRVYGGGTMTVSAEKKMAKIVVVLGSGGGTNEITTDVGTMDGNVWEGESNNVVFTVGGSSGHQRIQQLIITYLEETTPTELEVPGTVIWSSDEAKDLDWNGLVIDASCFDAVKVGDLLNIGILGAPEGASSSNWTYQVALQDGSSWVNLERGEPLKQAGDYVHSFKITGDMLKYMKQHGLILNGTKFQVKKVTVESAYTGSDESVWVGYEYGNVQIDISHAKNAHDFTGIKKDDIIRVTVTDKKWIGFQNIDSSWAWKELGDGVEITNNWAAGEQTIDILVKTDEAAASLNSGNGFVVIGGTSDPGYITQVEILSQETVEPQVVNITVTPASGTDIYEAYAAGVKKVTDEGNIVGGIHIILEENGNYTISNTLIAYAGFLIEGKGATVDALGLSGNMVELAVLEDPTEWKVIDGVGFLDLTVKGLKKSLFYSAGKNYAMAECGIVNCVIEQAGDATTIDFTKGSTAMFIGALNSTIYAPTATTKSFYSSQSGQKATEYNEDAIQQFIFKNNTMYNLAPTKNFFTHRQANQTWLSYDVENNIFVNCGKSGQVIRGMNGGQGGKNPTWTITGNLFNFNGEDTSAAESTGDDAEPVQNSVAGIVSFTAPTAPDFSGTVLLDPSATTPTALGDPRWTLTYAAALAINIAESEGGKVTASPSAAAEGMTVTLTVTPDEGYELESLTVKDAGDAEVTVADDNTFTMPSTDVTVTATFKKLPVDVAITVESGKDIAAEVEAAADGAPIKSITVTLEENGEYTISKSLTAQGNVTINGAEGAVIDASGLTAPLIQMATLPTEGLNDKDALEIDGVTIKDVKITGLQYQLFFANKQNYLLTDLIVDNSVIELAGAKKTIFDFNGGGNVLNLTVNKSTLYGTASATWANGGFYSSQSGKGVQDLKADAVQTTTITNSTLYNIAKNSTTSSRRRNSQSYILYVVKDNIIVDCGKSGQFLAGLNAGQAGKAEEWTVSGNTFFFDGADVSATEDEKIAGTAEGSLTSDPEFADAANGDFTVGEATDQAELETGDPRWLVEYAGGEGDATDLLAEIEEAKKLLKYSMNYYDENNAESPETEGKALVDAIREAEAQAEGGTSQKKLDKTLEELKQAEKDYADAKMEYELTESEAILAVADPADELAGELQRLYDTQDVVRANFSNQPKHIKNYADELDKAQKAFLRNALNTLIPEAQALAADSEVRNALDKADQALVGDSSEDLFDALNSLLDAMSTATGIRGIEADEADNAPVYNMNGQRVSSSTKGIVIKNGRKVVRK